MNYVEDNLNDKSLKELMIKILEDKSDVKKEKDKGFLLPYLAKVTNRKAKNGWATYLYINENKTIKFKKYPIQEQTVMIDGVPRTALPEEMLYYKGKPFIIQPAWSVRPFSAEASLDKSIDEKNNSNGWRLLLNRVESQELKPKRSVPIWLIVIGVVVLGGIGYFAFKGGLFN